MTSLVTLQTLSNDVLWIAKRLCYKQKQKKKKNKKQKTNKQLIIYKTRVILLDPDTEQH